MPGALPGAPRRDVPEEPALPEPPADGGGGIMLLASPPAVPFGLREVPDAPPEDHIRRRWHHILRSKKFSNDAAHE